MTLRDSPETLAEKIHPVGESTPSQTLLGFESGSDYWLVDLTDAGEVLPVPILSTVLLTQSWFLGIANIRGTLYSVTDFAAFHAAESTPIKAQSRLLLAGPRFGCNIALLMSRTLGLKTLPAMQALPAMSTEATAQQPWRGESYRDSEGIVWTRLQLPALLSAAQFLDISI
jgi:twitching motility protein PilI